MKKIASFIADACLLSAMLFGVLMVILSALASMLLPLAAVALVAVLIIKLLF